MIHQPFARVHFFAGGVYPRRVDDLQLDMEPMQPGQP